MGQTTIFEMLYSTFKINKPIRLIELFAGYGSQALALKYLGVEFEHWKICEWAVKSIQAYKDIHFTEDNTDYSKPLSIETIKDYLLEAGISSNYNEPMTREQINRLNEKQARTIFNNICSTHNLVNIQQVKGKDLEIEDTDKYCYMMTYSFPCQDLSLAGLGKGMSDTSTRSGMLWEVERILTECKELGNLPQVLLMENVPQVHGADNVEDFNKWQLRLEELGYKNYWQDMIATDYGIPQTRNRTFMVSILGDYNYTFPKPISLKLKLKDMLEDEVDEKYYLSEKMLEYITSKDDKYKVNENKLVINRNVACSKTTREGNTRTDTTDYVCDDLPENYNIKNGCKQIYDLNYYNHEQSNRIYDINHSSPTLRTKCDEAGAIKIEEVINTYDEYNHKINGNETIGTIQAMYPVPNHGHRLIIKNNTKKGYLEATDGDGIDISSRMEHHRGNVQKDKIQTLTTSGGNDRRVVINMRKDLCNNLIEQNKVEENDIIKINYTTDVLNGKKDYKLNNNISSTLTTASNNEIAVVNNMRIRKLTPKECFRLMGVKDEDFEKVKKNQSDSSLYHLAGDSIVVNVLMAIFKEMIE